MPTESGFDSLKSERVQPTLSLSKTSRRKVGRFKHKVRRAPQSNSFLPGRAAVLVLVDASRWATL